MQINNHPGVSNFINTGDTNLVRAMPTVGLEYRYPFISVQSWGTQTVEPIAQIIARPNEPQVGKWPNEDAQSLIFDDSNLFRSTSSPAGTASRAAAAPITACNTPRSSTKAAPSMRCSASPTAVRAEFLRARRPHQYRPRQRPRHHPLRLCGAGLLPAEQDLHLHLALPLRQRHLRRAADGTRGPRQVRPLERQLLYGDYAAQPELGFLDRRQGILGTGSVKLDANWVLLGGARYDINAGKFDQNPRRPRLCRRLPHLGPELHY